MDFFFLTLTGDLNIMAKTAVYFELIPYSGNYTVPAGKHLIVTNHRGATDVGAAAQTITVNGGEVNLGTSTHGRLTGAVLPSGTILRAAGASSVKQSISGYLVDN